MTVVGNGEAVIGQSGCDGRPAHPPFCGYTSRRLRFTREAGLGGPGTPMPLLTCHEVRWRLLSHGLPLPAFRSAGCTEDITVQAGWPWAGGYGFLTSQAPTNPTGACAQRLTRPSARLRWRHYPAEAVCSLLDHESAPGGCPSRSDGCPVYRAAAAGRPNVPRELREPGTAPRRWGCAVGYNYLIVGLSDHPSN